MRAASLISVAHLVIEPNTAGKSISWNASRSRISRATWPTNMMSGVESWRAMWMPCAALVAPGPRVVKQMPGRPVALPIASAMMAAPASWRHTVMATSRS